MFPADIERGPSPEMNDHDNKKHLLICQFRVNKFVISSEAVVQSYPSENLLLRLLQNS